MTGIYQGMIEGGSPLQWVTELFSPGSRDGSRFDAPVDTLPKYGDGASLGEYGLRVHRDVPHAEMVRMFGGDYIGWRQGNDIYIAADRKGVPLSKVQRDAVYLHEVCAGENHFRSDAEAQKLAEEEAARLLKKDPRYVSLLNEVRAQSTSLGF
ncbi:MAG: hypothetical protein HYT72_01920 [Candidatus Aenigmarchaeota archaeon]|nr:hypothetical protein [Candidatus Aenigmarchaeota archaeon]